MRCWSIAGLPPALSSPVPIYTPGWREALWEWSVLPKNTTQCPRPGLEPGPLDPETSALTMRPPRSPYQTWKVVFKSHFQTPKREYALCTIRSVVQNCSCWSCSGWFQKQRELKGGQGRLVRVALVWESHSATCVLACVILYHVTGLCKGSTENTTRHVFLKSFNVSGGRVKHCLECLMFFSIETKEKTEKWNRTCKSMLTISLMSKHCHDYAFFHSNLMNYEWVWEQRFSNSWIIHQV